MNLLNGEGKQARDLAQGDDVRRLLNSVEQQEMKARENLFLDAARDGDIDAMKKLLVSVPFSYLLNEMHAFNYCSQL